MRNALDGGELNRVKKLDSSSTRVGEETNRTNLVSGPDFLARARKKRAELFPKAFRPFCIFGFSPGLRIWQQNVVQELLKTVSNFRELLEE